MKPRAAILTARSTSTATTVIHTGALGLVRTEASITVMATPHARRAAACGRASGHRGHGTAPPSSPATGDSRRCSLLRWRRRRRLTQGSDMDGYSVKALGESTWGDFAAMVERNTGLFSGCWCTWFHPQDREEDEANRPYKERMVRAGVAHAALVFKGDQAVAWAEYGTPEELPNIHHRKQYEQDAGLPPDYRITCIYVDKRHRRTGLAEVAL